MKLTFQFILLTIVVNFNCFSHGKIDMSNSSQQSIIDMNLKFESWKMNEIKLGHFRSNCDGFNFDTYNKNNEYSRFGLDKTRYAVSYGDFNNDKLIDGLFTIYFDDCAQGNGYIEWPEDSHLLVLSSKSGYSVDNFYLNKIYNSLKSLKKNLTRDDRGYIYNLSISNGAIGGELTLWKPEDCNGCSSIGGFWGLNKNKNEITFNLTNKSNEIILEKSFKLR